MNEFLLLVFILLYIFIGALVAGFLDFGPVDGGTIAIGLFWPISIPVYLFGATIKTIFLVGRKAKIKIFGEDRDCD